MCPNYPPLDPDGCRQQDNGVETMATVMLHDGGEIIEQVNAVCAPCFIFRLPRLAAVPVLFATPPLAISLQNAAALRTANQ